MNYSPKSVFKVKIQVNNVSKEGLEAKNNTTSFANENLAYDQSDEMSNTEPSVHTEAFQVISSNFSLYRIFYATVELGLSGFPRDRIPVSGETEQRISR